MGLFDRFKKPKTDKAFQKEKSRQQTKHKKAKLKKKSEAEAKKKRFQAVGTAAPTSGQKTEGKKKTAKKKTRTETGLAPKVLVKPIISEKSTSLTADNKYVFAVSKKSNKIEIKKAFKHLYGYQPLSINIINISGKQVRYGRSTGRTKNWKKAVITLKPGDKIDINS